MSVKFLESRLGKWLPLIMLLVLALVGWFLIRRPPDLAPVDEFETEIPVEIPVEIPDGDDDSPTVEVELPTDPVSDPPTPELEKPPQ